MNAIEFLIEANSVTKKLVQSGYPNSTGVPNTWLREYDAERYIPLISRASRIIFDGPCMIRDNRVMQRVWENAFRFPVLHSAERPGNKPLSIYLERLEMLYLFSSVLASIALTARMKKDEIYELVGDLFQKELDSTSLYCDTVYGLHYDEGSYEERFFRRSLRISVSTFGRIESLTPMVTMVLPSQVDAYDAFNPLNSLDDMFYNIQADWSFEDTADRTAFQALISSWIYSQGLKLKEYSDENFKSLFLDDPGSTIE